MQFAYDAGQERRNKIAAARRMLLHGTQNHIFHATDFHFNIEENLVAVALQNIFQTGRFFACSLAWCFAASTSWRKSDSLRPACSRMALAAASKSLKVLGLTGATCEITALVSASTFSDAPQQGQLTSNGTDEDFAIRKL